MKNTLHHYGLVTKLLHWVMAGLFIGMFIVAYVMTYISKSDFRMSLYDLHKATGLLLFALVVLRVGWRYCNIQPVTPEERSSWRQLAKLCIVFAFYILMIVMPLSGFLTSTAGGHAITFYGLFTIAPLAQNAAVSAFFSGAHEWLSYGLIACFSVHVAAALYHHFLLRDNVLRRMWFKPLT